MYLNLEDLECQIEKLQIKIEEFEERYEHENQKEIINKVKNMLNKEANEKFGLSIYGLLKELGVSQINNLHLISDFSQYELFPIVTFFVLYHNVNGNICNITQVT